MRLRDNAGTGCSLFILRVSSQCFRPVTRSATAQRVRGSGLPDWPGRNCVGDRRFPDGPVSGLLAGMGIVTAALRIEPQVGRLSPDYG